MPTNYLNSFVSLAGFNMATASTLTYQGTSLAAKGHINVIQGPSKSGKTMFAVLLMCANLSPNGYMGFASTMEDAKVLYIDTENDTTCTAQVAARVHYLCGWPTNEDSDRFTALNISEHTPEVRREIIAQAIEALKPTAVFIESTRDLITDFNDPYESEALINDLNTMARKHQCTMWLTQRALTNAGRVTPRGHLGNGTVSKASSAFTLYKCEDSEGKTYFAATNTLAANNATLPRLTFKVESTGSPEGREIGIPLAYDEAPNE